MMIVIQIDHNIFVYSVLSHLRKNLKQVFKGHWTVGFQHAMDFCGIYSGKVVKQELPLQQKCYF